MRFFLILMGVWFSLAATTARADIYAFIDEQGSAHFAVEKIDARYELYLKGDQSFDSSDLGKGITVKPALMRYLSEHPNLKKFEPLLKHAATEYAVDPALLKAVMAAESGFNPSAISPKGAVGLMQVMPATAERYGLHGDAKKTVTQKLADPKTNIDLGARYLRDLHKMFPKQQHLVLASYNAGEGAVQKYRNMVPPYPETRNYVQLVTQFYRLYKPKVTQSEFAVTSDAGSKRIYMTIPGRSNMPAPATAQ
jgi:soluble lytic murein transglycosylase-like protein